MTATAQQLQFIKDSIKTIPDYHYNSPCGQMSAGVWEGEVGQWKVNYTEHEYCEIVQGVSVLRDADGNAKTLRAGDRFVIPAGFSGTWEVLEPCRKIYVVFEEKA